MAVPQAGEARHATATPKLNSNTQEDCGTDVVGQIYFPGGVSLFSGLGAPGKVANGKTPVVGDLYFRIDGAVGSLIYRCTVPAAGTWVVVL